MQKICCHSFIKDCLEISEAGFFDICDRAPNLYKRWAEPKPSGGHRIIDAPFGELKLIQAVLKDELSRIPLEEGIYGKPGSSTIDAMRPHVRKPMLVTADIADFFPSISIGKLRSLFADILDDSSFVDSFVRLTSTKRRLPQGSPTSPVLARLAIEPAFVDIKDALESIDPRCAVTIWVDDISVSGPVGIKRALRLIRKILNRHGFDLREEKTEAMPRNAVQSNLGLEVGNSLKPVRRVIEAYEKSVKVDGYSSPRARGYRNYVKSIRRAANNKKSTLDVGY